MSHYCPYYTFYNGGTPKTCVISLTQCEWFQSPTLIPTTLPLVLLEGQKGPQPGQLLQQILAEISPALFLVKDITFGALQSQMCWLTDFVSCAGQILSCAAKAALRRWTYAFQPPEPDLCATARLMTSSQTWNQRPNPPLHPWGNFFHRLWLLSDSSLRDEAPFSINSSDMDLQAAPEEPNEALQTWDSIWGDSPRWGRRSHYVRGWSCGSILSTTRCSKSDGSVSQQLRPFMSPSLCLDLLICLLARVIVCNISSLLPVYLCFLQTDSSCGDTRRHDTWEGTNKLVPKTAWQQVVSHV